MKKISNTKKYGPKPIIDEFTDLPVSRQRKKQLRNIKKGLCEKCSKKIFKSNLCKDHYYKSLSYNRERAKKLRESSI